MRRTRIVHHGKAYAQLIKLPAIQADLYRRARNIATAAGGAAEGFHPVYSQPRVRARAAVIASRGDSDNKLIRNIDAGRL